MLNIPSHAIVAKQVTTVSDIEASTEAIPFEEPFAYTPRSRLRGFAEIYRPSGRAIFDESRIGSRFT